MASIDVQAYFQRIGYTGTGAPTLNTLRELVARHTGSIPFENLNPLLNQPVRLDAASLEQKLVRDGRGGYCHEQNLLFRHVLEELGFRVTGLAAGVVWNRPAGEMTARTHMLLRLDLDEGLYLADVGFGGQTLTGPLRLEVDAEQATPHEPFRLIRSDDEFLLQSKIRNEWRPLYRFSLQPQRLRDYEVGNWYVSTHPDSIFVKNLMVGRPTADRRYALLNNSLSVHHLNGPSERRVLDTVAELRETLTDVFQITLPRGTELDAVLARCVNPPQ